MIAVILLAAGQGTRMNSAKQKILHDVGGRPMVLHAYLSAAAVADLPPVLVVAPGETGIEALIGDRASYVVQPTPLGTGHATRMAEPVLRDRADQVIVTYADMPLLRAETLRRLALTRQQTAAAVVMLSVLGDPSSSFGRVVRDRAGRVCEIVEVVEARTRPNAGELLDIRELNVGVYCFDGSWLWDQIGSLPIRRARQGEEYYLTDLVAAAVAQGREVVALRLEDPDEGLGAGTRAELAVVERAFRRRASAHWLGQGVTLIDPETTYIDADVVIGRDTVLWPNTYLQGRTSIGEDCTIGPGVILREATVGSDCHVEMAVVEHTSLADGERVVPFTYRHT